MRQSKIYNTARVHRVFPTLAHGVRTLVPCQPQTTMRRADHLCLVSAAVPASTCLFELASLGTYVGFGV